MLLDMWSMRTVVEQLGAAGAARNAEAVLDAHRRALAEVDSVVDRIHRNVPVVRPAA